jgi:TRAP-type mannitol/chloroaromatic compound transport system substrate-binding protein
MKRSGFLRAAAALGAGAALGLNACRKKAVPAPERVPGEPGKVLHWTMVTTWPPKFPALGEGCALFADWVRIMSGGILDIRVYGAGELIPGMEVFDAVSAGTAQLGSGAAYYWAGKLPAAQFFGSVPFGMNAQQMQAWLLSGGGLALWEEIYAPFDLIPFPAGNTGIQMGGWFRKPIERIEDLQGLKMRIPGLGGKVLERAGGTAVLSAGSEIYTNLERGVIDATEWIGPYHDLRMGFPDIAKYYYYPGWHEPGSTLEIMVNRQAFLALPEWLQEVVRSAALRLHSWVLAEFDARNAIHLEDIRKDTTVQILRFPPEVLQRLRTLTRDVLNDLIAGDPLSRKVHNAYFDFYRKVTPWSEISEKEYYRLGGLINGSGSQQ